MTGLRWNDIDLEAEEIDVNHTLVYYNHRDEKGCYFSINTPKTAAGCRVIPMTKGVKEAFLMEKAYQEEAEIKSVGNVDGYHDFIFINKDGNVQHYGTLNKAIRRIIRDCNDEVLETHDIDSDPVLLPDFSCHTLRHPYVKPKTKNLRFFWRFFIFSKSPSKIPCAPAVPWLELAYSASVLCNLVLTTGYNLFGLLRCTVHKFI